MMKYLHELGIETSTSTAVRKFSIEGLRWEGWIRGGFLCFGHCQVTRKPADDEVSLNSQNAAVLKLDAFERLTVRRLICSKLYSRSSSYNGDKLLLNFWYIWAIDLQFYMNS